MLENGMLGMQSSYNNNKKNKNVADTIERTCCNVGEGRMGESGAEEEEEEAGEGTGCAVSLKSLR